MFGFLFFQLLVANITIYPAVVNIGNNYFVQCQSMDFPTELCYCYNTIIHISCSTAFYHYFIFKFTLYLAYYNIIPLSCPASYYCMFIHIIVCALLLN